MLPILKTILAGALIIFSGDTVKQSLGTGFYNPRVTTVAGSISTSTVQSMEGDHIFMAASTSLAYLGLNYPAFATSTFLNQSYTALASSTFQSLLSFPLAYSSTTHVGAGTGLYFSGQNLTVSTTQTFTSVTTDKLSGFLIDDYSQDNGWAAITVNTTSYDGMIVLNPNNAGDGAFSLTLGYGNVSGRREMSWNSGFGSPLFEAIEQGGFDGVIIGNSYTDDSSILPPNNGLMVQGPVVLGINTSTPGIAFQVSGTSILSTTTISSSTITTANVTTLNLVNTIPVAKVSGALSGNGTAKYIPIYSGASTFVTSTLSFDSTTGNLTIGNPIGGAASLTIIDNNKDMLSMQDTSNTQYTRILYQGTGRTYTAGVGNHLETTYNLANRYYIFDYTASTTRFSIDAWGNIIIGLTSTAFSSGVTSTLSATSTSKYITILGASASSTGGLEFNLQNQSKHPSSSADYIVTSNNGSSSTFFIDMGVNNSTYSNPAFGAFGPNDGYLYVNGGNLLIGTASSSQQIKFFTGGSLSTNLRMSLQDNLLYVGTSTQIVGLTVNGLTTLATTTITSSTITYLNATNLTSTGSLVIPYSSSLLTTIGGMFGLDTTSGQMRANTGSATTTYDSYKRLSFQITTSTNPTLQTGTTTIYMGAFLDNTTITGITCYTTSTALSTSTIQLFNASNAVMITYTATSSPVTAPFAAISSNNTLSAYAPWIIQVGNGVGTLGVLNCTIKYTTDPN